MILGIISKEDHAKNHARGLTEDGHTVFLLGSSGERIPENLDAMICRIASCSHRGSAVAREWKRATGRPLIVEDGLAGIRRQIKLLTDSTPAPVSIPTPEPTPVQVDVTPCEPPTPVRVPPLDPAPLLPPEEPMTPTSVRLSPPPPPPPSTPTRHISRGPYAEWTRAKRVAVLTEIFRENPGMDGSAAWKLHEIQTAPRASVDREMIAEARRAAQGGIPRIATVPTPEVPVAVLAATPADRKPTRDAPTDVKELVQLLRVAMEAEGIEKLVVTKDSVSFRRVVVEEGHYDV